MSGPSQPARPGAPGAEPEEFFAETSVKDSRHLHQRDPRRGLLARVHNQSGRGTLTEYSDDGNKLPDFDGQVMRIHPHARPLREPPHPEGSVHYLVDTDQLPPQPLPPTPTPVPPFARGNQLYGSLRTSENLWRYAIEYTLTGSYTAPAAGTSFAALLTTASGSNVQPFPVRLRLCEYPYSMQAYLCLRSFAASPRTLSDTGNITWTYQGYGGHTIIVNLGDAGSSVNDDFLKFVPDAITDATPPNLGTLQIASSAGGVYAATWDWAISFAIVYLKPGPLE